ncbi:RimJ/RimL family protein N-acetyltransferase [Micromonospora sp. M71_S20]|uniref:GNAT family N-acetyltransferase n=1 Tax=Micromonospora sp. M71_S20 TaxID=592872 RepID=UPI000F29FBA4|nr:GNAT family N-acetyltransferase [Micromonospora sp. M71_S20]RLK25016.1 RimJ/RimL family protein N-acetyltransferase [Micromonospora sp. M71_S20]
MDASPGAAPDDDAPTAAPPAVGMRLRDVEPGDLDAYVRMRCDPAVMAELGGPQPRERVAAQLRRDLETVRDGSAWIKMIVPGGSAQVAGTVTLYSHGGVSEIGWMVVPEFQGRGLAGRAVRAVLALARTDGRWSRIHAFPATTNAASNAICRSVGFALVGEEQREFAGRLFRTNHWVVDPSAGAADSSAGGPGGDVPPT